MEPTLVGAAVFGVLATALYAKVGLQHARRQVGAEKQRAARMFGVWWLALAAATFLGALSTFSGALGLASVLLFTALLIVTLLLICVGLLGLLHYLLFLFTGRDFLKPLAVGYGVYFIALCALILDAGPVSVAVGRWTTSLVYARPFGSSVSTVLLALLVFPQILGAVAYLTVAFRVKERTPRFRIVAVSGSIIVWFLSSVMASAGNLSGQDWWQVANRGLGLGAALATYIAYNPPRFLTRTYGIAPFTPEQQEGMHMRERAQRAAVALVLLRRALAGATTRTRPTRSG